MKRTVRAQSQPSSPHRIRLRIDAAGIADAERSVPGPVSIWLDRPADRPHGIAPHPHDAGDSVVLRIGSPDDPDAPTADHVLDRTDAVLMPGMVNAHCHLDLTSVGLQSHDPGVGFVEWVRMVIERRPVEPGPIRDAMKEGIAKSLAGGAVAVGDILGAARGVPTTSGLAALAESPLAGVGFVEFFGIAGRRSAGSEALRTLARELAAWPAGARIRLGLHPHAPNTVSLLVYEEAAALAVRDDLPISTHLAETDEEREFIGAGTGPQRELLERMGIWDDSELTHIGRGRHPVEHLRGVLGRTPFLVAHVNDAPDEAIATLARTGATVAYCPRASVYFGAPDRFGPHRFGEMLDAGVNVCLGTDSIINLDTPDRITPLDDARLLARTTDTPARTLMEMMTTRGAVALGLDPRRYIFREGGAVDGVVAVPVSESRSGPASVEPCGAILREQTPPELLLC